MECSHGRNIRPAPPVANRLGHIEGAVVMVAVVVVMT
jgi:hypothetical protein